MSLDDTASLYAVLAADLRLDAARIGALTGSLAANDIPTAVLYLPPAAAPAPAAADPWAITWTLADRLLVPLALLFAAASPRGTHRRDRHAVRRHGLWLRPTVRPQAATAPDRHTRTGGTR